jgi:amicyanin-dependent methylamine dehydrogenase small subunit
MSRLFALFDRAAEQAMRGLAQKTSRRSALAWLGGAVAGGALPILPFDRTPHAQATGGQPTTGQTTSGHGAAAERPAGQKAGEYDCDYWRYCSVDGFLCSCCGGSATSCPPGSTISKVTWVGTCRNPEDGRDYLVSYNDCCGRTSCNRCFCNTNHNERPGYRMGVHNDINWCMANANSVYHCTVSVIVGLDEGD